MKIKQLLTLIRRDYGPDVTLTPELGEEIASFVRGQAEPHAVFRYNDCGVLCCAVTGEHEATFPVHKLSGYDTEIESLKAACLWAESCGALTYEWLSDEVPTSGHTEMVRKCDVPTCEVMVRERNAHYTDDTRWRLCRFHAEMLDADDLARLVDEPETPGDRWVRQMNAPEVDIRVGGRYRTNTGEEVDIDMKREDCNYAWVGKSVSDGSRMSFTIDGRYHEHGGSSRHDIVAEVKS